jgi:hypothetical protein
VTTVGVTTVGSLSQALTAKPANTAKQILEYFIGIPSGY